MSIFVKVAVALLLTLPLGAYVAGTLVASQARMPEERAPLVVESTPSSGTTDTGPSRSPRPSPSDPTPDDRRPDEGSDDRHDDSDDRGHDDSEDVKVVRPSPREVEDDREDRADEAEDAREDAADEAEDALDSDDRSGDD